MERGRIRKGQKREGTVMEMYAHEKGNINEHTIFLWPFNYCPFKRKGLSGVFLSNSFILECHHLRLFGL